MRQHDPDDDGNHRADTTPEAHALVDGALEDTLPDAVADCRTDDERHHHQQCGHPRRDVHVGDEEPDHEESRDGQDSECRQGVSRVLVPGVGDEVTLLRLLPGHQLDLVEGGPADGVGLVADGEHRVGRGVVAALLFGLVHQLLEPERHLVPSDFDVAVEEPPSQAGGGQHDDADDGYTPAELHGNASFSGLGPG